MSNGAGNTIEEFYSSKKKEGEGTLLSPPEAKKTVKLLFEKVGDVCSVDVDGFQVQGTVTNYTIERVGEIERMQVDLEVISE